MSKGDKTYYFRQVRQERQQISSRSQGTVRLLIVATEGLSGLCLKKKQYGKFKNKIVMGRQEGIIQLRGRVGNVSFFKTKEGDFMARKSNGIDGERIKTDRSYRRTRENMAEFARACVASKLLRTALRSSVLFLGDGRVSNRLTGAMMRVLKADTSSKRGERNLVNGDPGLLQGFQFNRHADLTKTFLQQFDTVIDRATGNMVINIPAFIPDNMVVVPDGATHLRFRAAGVSVDFAAGTYSITTAESADVPIVEELHEAIQLTVTAPAASPLPLFLLFGIEFQQLANGTILPLSSGAYNAIAIVKVDKAV